MKKLIILLMLPLLFTYCGEQSKPIDKDVYIITNIGKTEPFSHSLATNVSPRTYIDIENALLKRGFSLHDSLKVAIISNTDTPDLKYDLFLLAPNSTLYIGDTLDMRKVVSNGIITFVVSGSTLGFQYNGVKTIFVVENSALKRN